MKQVKEPKINLTPIAKINKSKKKKKQTFQ
jgi:hypothetical protein